MCENYSCFGFSHILQIGTFSSFVHPSLTNIPLSGSCTDSYILGLSFMWETGGIDKACKQKPYKQYSHTP